MGIGPVGVVRAVPSAVRLPIAHAPGAATATEDTLGRNAHSLRTQAALSTGTQSSQAVRARSPSLRRTGNGLRLFAHISCHTSK